MEGERVAIAQCPPAMPAPCLPTITAAHYCSELDANHDGTRICRRERNRLHVGAKGLLCRRKPEPARRNATKRCQFRPTRAAIARREEQSRVRSSVDRPRLRTPGGQGFDDLPGQAN